MADYNRRVTDHGFLPSQSPIKDDLQQLYARNTSQTEEIIETLRGISDTQLMVLSELQTLESLSHRSESAAEVVELTKEHLEKIAKIIYTTNGYNEKGEKIPEGVLRFEKITNVLQHAFWNFIIVGILSTLFYFYVEAQKEQNQNKTKALLEMIQKVEDNIGKDKKKETSK